MNSLKAPKITQQHVFDLLDLAKTEFRNLSQPLTGMERNFTEAEQIALSYFLATLTLLNRLTHERISDKVVVEFGDLDGESVYGV